MLAQSSFASDRIMPALYSRSFRRLEDRKRRLLQSVEGWSPEWLRYAPSPDAWSMLQVFDHLIRTERAVRESSERNLLRQRTDVSLRERVRARCFLIFYRLPIRVRIPQAVAFIKPGDPLSLGEITERWKEERRLLYEFLLRQDLDTSHSIVMRHPAVGPFSLRDALRFLAVHLLHHQAQMLRLRSAIASAFL